MIKKHKLVLSSVVALSLLGSGLGSVMMPAVQAQAKAKTTLKTFPKSIRGTWYQYGPYRYHAVKFTAKGFAWQANVATKLGGLAPLHAHKAPFSGSKTSSHMWLYAVKKQGFTKVGWWNSTVTLELGGYYKLTSKKVNGKKIKVLKRTTSLSHPRYYDYFYTSKKIAKKYKITNN